MKVYIGPYVNWFGPYQLAERILFWKDKYHKDHEIADKNREQIYKLGEWLSGSKDKPSKLSKFLTWVDSKRNRKINIRIDNYDVWSMDHTLALIIVPMLKQLKEQKHGCPHVDNKDVPKELRYKGSEPEPIESLEKRWDWVLEEMIWAFEQHSKDDWEEQYYSGTHDYTIDDDGNFHIGHNDTFKVDRDGMTKHSERMRNGRMLFAKYYESLWD